MKEIMNTRKAALILCLALLSVSFLTVTALNAQTERKATVINVDGVADVQKTGSSQWVPAEKGMVLGSGDTLRTTLDSVVDLKLDDGGALRVAEETQMTIEALASDKQQARFLYFFNRPVEAQKSKLKLAQGKVIASLAKLPTSQSSFRVETPTGIAGVRGTTWGVETKTEKAATGENAQVDTVSVQQGAAWVSEKGVPASGIDALLAPIAKAIKDLGSAKVFGPAGGPETDDESPNNSQFLAEGQQGVFSPGKPVLVEALPETFVSETADLSRAAEKAGVGINTTPVVVQDANAYIHNTVEPSFRSATGSIGDPQRVEEKTLQTNPALTQDKNISSTGS